MPPRRKSYRRRVEQQKVRTLHSSRRNEDAVAGSVGDVTHFWPAPGRLTARKTLRSSFSSLIVPMLKRLVTLLMSAGFEVGRVELVDRGDVFEDVVLNRHDGEQLDYVGGEGDVGTRYHGHLDPIVLRVLLALEIAQGDLDREQDLVVLVGAEEEALVLVQ